MMKIEELKRRYQQLYPDEGVDELILDKIEDILELRLPKDFREISSFYSGGLLGGISSFACTFEKISPNIVEETKRLREAIELPLNFIALAEPPESLIVMDTIDIASVIWCDAIDAAKLSHKLLIRSPKVWNTYLEFFANMLEDEEE